jgi:RNA polymerase sigma-70 factor, ECF subfamily
MPGLAQTIITAGPIQIGQNKLVSSSLSFGEKTLVSPDPFATSKTLIGRLAVDPSSETWREFVDKYAPTVYTWAWQSGLQESDAADVTQEVLLKLLEKMRVFHYDPARGSFRGWLKTITVNAARDCGRRLARLPVGPAGLSSVGDPSSWDDLGKRIDEEYRRQLLMQAEATVSGLVHKNTWQAYEMLVKDGTPVIQVAKSLEMKVAEVYVAKSRVLKRLKDIIHQIEQTDGQTTEMDRQQPRQETKP